MAQNLTINGVTYSSVTSLSIPKSAGGNAAFPDTSDANATESDILSGKTAYVNGIKLTGTGTGGGGTTVYTITKTGVNTDYCLVSSYGVPGDSIVFSRDVSMVSTVLKDANNNTISYYGNMYMPGSLYFIMPASNVTVICGYSDF